LSVTTTPEPSEPSAWSAPVGGGQPSGRQEERSQLSTRRLLDACASLIAERGYERTTLADIGKRAGYSQGLVTRRFGSKANLVAVLVERMAARFGSDRIADTVGNRSGAAAVSHVVREIRDDARRSPDGLRGFYALLFEGVRPVPELHERLRAINRSFRYGIAEFLTRGIDAGTLRPGIDPLVAANMVTSSLRGIAYFWLLDPDDFDVVSELGRLAEFLDMVLAPPAAGQDPSGPDSPRRSSGPP
jgi:AcrR family transcriptional regulator